MKTVTIIGSGITGITAAYLINFLAPQTKITLIDAGPEPRFSKFRDTHHGATLGESRDARHFTGTEGLSLQNSIHPALLFKSAQNRGWRTIPEKELNNDELRWRAESVSKFENDVKDDKNPYDEAYTILNYAGMQAWEWLSRIDPEIARFRISDKNVYVAFQDIEGLESDFNGETKFNLFQKENPVEVVDFSAAGENFSEKINLEKLAPQLLKLPGSVWRIKSLWIYFYRFLSKNSNTKFIWNKEIKSKSDLPDSDSYLWAVNSLHATPWIYDDYPKIQGMGGWWLSLGNPGFLLAFKYAARNPNGYINFTPDGNKLHISGGFGWVGTRGFEEAKGLLQHTKQYFLEEVSSLLKMPREELDSADLGCCIRPCTPTGLPDANIQVIDEKTHVSISSAHKAGATQAALLGLWSANVVGLEAKGLIKDSNEVITQGLSLLGNGLKL